MPRRSLLQHALAIAFSASGLSASAQTITVSKNEILAGLNKPEDYILAIVEVKFTDGSAQPIGVHYLRRPFRREPDFAATSVNYSWKELM